MITKTIKYVVLGVLAFVLVSLACSEKLRSEVALIWPTITGNAVAKLELQVDQGALALQRFDNEYIRAQQKLTQLKAVARDTLLNMRRAQEHARDYRAQGKEELARRNDEQAAFCESQHAMQETAIQNLEAKLIELKATRERAREDVRLARERISILLAQRDAMDQTGMKDTLDRAEENVRNLQSTCNRLISEIEVLNITEE